LIGSRRASLVGSVEECTVQAIADTDLDRARRAAEPLGCRATASWQEVVTAPDVDAVVVATPNRVATDVAIAAAEHGKHVLCEKPLGRNAGEAARIVAAARRHGVTLKTGFNHRHHPAIAAAHAAVAGGEIGTPMFLRCVYGHGGRPGYDKEWRGNAELAGGGELLDQGVHVMDLSRWFLGEFEEVMGVTPRWFWDIAPLEDNAFAVMRTARGQVAQLHTSWTQWRNRFSFEVFGLDGYAAVEGLGGSYGLETLTIGRRRQESGPPEQRVTEYPGPDVSWTAEWREFVTAIRERREPLANGEDGLEALRLVAAVYRAAESRSVTRVAAVS
jgi:predicted dehydrogenase